MKQITAAPIILPPLPRRLTQAPEAGIEPPGKRKSRKRE